MVNSLTHELYVLYLSLTGNFVIIIFSFFFCHLLIFFLLSFWDSFFFFFSLGFLLIWMLTLLILPSLSLYYFLSSAILVICLLAIKWISVSSLFQPLHFLYVVFLVLLTATCFFFILPISCLFSLKYF